MRRPRTALWWSAPPLICLLLYWHGLTAWFQTDDFAWLGLGLEVHDARSLWDALFQPRAQGTIRPWSERVFFMGFHALFGLDALPFRVWVFLTQFANLALLASITRRLTGSAAAGFLAAAFWLANSSLAQPMAWTSAYNQVLCAFFILLAFHFLLRYLETGRRRYQALQWCVFLLGFGAQELNVVYPGLAAAFTLLCARKHFRGTLPLFVPSLLYTVAHLSAAPPQESGVYVMHWHLSIFRTLATYWSWGVGPSWLLTPWEMPVAAVLACVLVLTAALLAFAGWKAARGDQLPLFFLAWFAIALAPVLPLRDHITDYYLFLPTAGLAMLGGYAVTRAWRHGTAWRAAAAALAALYLALAAPAASAGTRWIAERSLRVERFVLGIARAHELHPKKTILLDGVSDELFWAGVLDRPYRLFGAVVYLTPGSQARIQTHPEYGDVAPYVLPADATARALDNDSVVVYAAGGPRLRNITSFYAKMFYHTAPDPPRRVDVANPLMAYLLGPTWFQPDQESRWMPKRATVRIGGPENAGQQLYITGHCPHEQMAAGALELSVAADGLPLGKATISREGPFDFSFALPPQLQGKPALEISLEAGRTFGAPGDPRQLALIFGVLEIR
jgi:hypothetical protein